MENKLIVLIDDEAEILFLLGGLLKSKGFEVKTFKSFQDAQEFLKGTNPLLIISDLNANGDINGIQFYLYYVMKKKLPFALHTASLEISEQGIQYFQGKIPDEYQLVPDKKTYITNERINLVIKDTVSQEETVFPCFFKPTMPETILEHFNFESPGT